MAERINQWCLIGIPDHQGVVNVGGRLGAAFGPKAFSEAFHRLKGRDGVHGKLAAEIMVSGLGNRVEANLKAASDVIRNQHEKNRLSVVVGGGHDHGYSHLKGIREAIPRKSRLGCINLDAHLDVRKPDPEITSGSPFYLALSEQIIDAKDFVEFGIQRHCNAPELWKFIEDLSISVIPYENCRNGKAVALFKQVLKKLSAKCDQIVISLDLDCASECISPGVSAPQAEGFSSSEIIEMMEIAGTQPKVCSLGVFELNPIHDEGGKTARFAATSAYHFLAHALTRV